jgi:VCBS repeat-containing protein
VLRKIRSPRPVFLVAVSASLSGLSACGGSSIAGGPPPAYAYVASADAGHRPVPGVVYQYTVGPDGSLTPMGITSVATGVAPTAMVPDPAGHYVYVANLGDATISQYAVGMAGELSPLSPAVVSIGGPFPRAVGGWMSVDPSGRFLYVVTLAQDPAGPSAAIEQYSIGSGGALTPLTPAYVDVPAFGYGPLAIDPSGHYAYLAGQANAPSGQVSQFSIGDDGTVSPLVPAAVAATAGAVSVTISPNGDSAYVLSVCVDSACDGQVSQYAIGASGALTSTGNTTLTGSHIYPAAMAIDDSGSSAYLLTNFQGVDTNTGAVYQYAINGTGALVPDTPGSLGVSSGAVGETASGTNLYALGSNAVASPIGSQSGGQVDQYRMGSSGVLAAIGTTPVAAGLPTAIVVVTGH